MNYINNYSRKLIGKYVFGFLIFSVVYRFISTSLVHQLEQPVFIYPHVDLTYWIVHFLKLPEFISGSRITSVFFDCSMFLLFIIGFYDARKRWVCFLSFIFYLIYILIYNTYSLHHTHPMAGGLFVLIPFFFKRDKDFTFLWEGVRYFALWVYGSAFIWKVCRGTFFHLEHGEATFKAMHANYLAHNEYSWLGGVIEWFIVHPLIAHVFLVLGFLLQGVFLVGFFTKKLDKLFFILPFIFHFTTYFFIEVAFVELLILNLAFIDWVYLQKKKNIA